MNHFLSSRYLVLGVSIVFLTATFGHSQEKLRIIQEVEHKTSPVVVVSRHVGDKAFDRSHQNRHGITAGRNWISSLSFDVKNVSNKNVNYIILDLDIPKAGRMEEIGGSFSIIFDGVANAANSANAATADKDSSGLLELLKPGEVVKLKMSDAMRTKLEAYLEKYDAENIVQIRTDIRRVYFDDGTGWAGGYELRQDPLNPKRWRSVTQGQVKNQMFSSPLMSAFVPIPLFSFLGNVKSFSIPVGCRNFLLQRRQLHEHPRRAVIVTLPEKTYNVRATALTRMRISFVSSLTMTR